MVLLLNIVLGLLAGVLADYLLGRAGVSDPVKLIVAVLVGVVVFLANLAAQVV